VERTLIIVKPDAVQRGLVGEVIARFERRGLRIIGMKFIHMDRELASEHYKIHKGKAFYEPLLDYITSGPVVVMALEGKDAILAARNTIGETNPAEANAGSIRGDFGMEIGRNLVHGSDSVANGEKEVSLFFAPDELVLWERDVDRWVFEG